MTIQANQGFGVSIFGATSAGGGGSTSPGGSSGQLQYNASGSFGGMAGTSWDDTNRALTLTGATVTTSQPVLNLSQTWNAGAVTFKGLVFNATDTASAAGSLLLDLQVGGASKFNLRKDGAAFFVGRAFMGNSTDSYIGGDTSQIYFGNVGASAVGFSVQSYVATALAGGASFGWTSNSTNATVGLDTILRRAAAATLQLGAADAAAPVAQTLQVQSVVAGTSNTAGANWTLKGSAGTGTGAGGSIIFQVAPAGSSGTAQNALATALTIGSDQNATFAGTVAAASSSAAAVAFARNGSAGTGIFFPSSANIGIAIGGGGYANFSTTAFAVNNDYAIGWRSSTAGSAVDTFLYRDGAANTLALRNAGTAQTFRVYSNADGSPGSNFQRLTLSAGVTANMAVVAADNGGTGVAMGLQFGAALTTGGGVTNIMNINTSGHLVWNTDNTYDIGASGANRPRNVFVAGNTAFGGELQGGSNSRIYATTGEFRTRSSGSFQFSSDTTGFGSPDVTLRRIGAGILGVRGAAATDAAALSFIEQTAPSAPATNGVYIYAEDNGAGKTRLMALFPTGAAQQIAIEP